MLDQAQRLRELANQGRKKESTKENKPKIITVTSGKGGVGKSNFVVNLGIELQKQGKRVLIFDADIGMANDDLLMGYSPKYNIYDIILLDKEIEEVIIEGPYGVKLLSGGTGINKIKELTSIQRNRFLEKLGNLENLDFILMDTGAGVNRTVLGFIACCDELVVIMTPEPTSLMDAYSLVKAVNHFKIKDSLNIIVNRILDDKEGEMTYNKFKQAVEKFLQMKVKLLGYVSEDKRLVEAVRNQKPFVLGSPNCSAAKDIAKISRKLMNSDLKNNDLGTKNLFKKIFNIFS
ncbi:MinD/ParA family protein [Clostridium cellulovorans]|uniref:MinD family ATPase n=1 Tax=Clostridium cellulovorans (strain ATCC 35296 / DSM 3052 / OCM 3 / 743B) TaxID=573061 RepID=D9SKI1_CLOC7|nr:MinD/ParA family protein [Clostridium cellulovorans]ADL51477.1 MinD family ATPase [Clostridium cellulovorans 743B]